MITIRSLFSALVMTFALTANAQGTWTQVADHPGQWYAQASFSFGGKGYVCTGYNAAQNTAGLWEYDPAADVWTEKAALPGGARQYASAFAIGDTGYVLCGWDNVNEIDYNDLWAYYPQTNTWQQKASLPANPRYAGVAFSIDGIGYFGTGAASAVWYNDLWAYDPTTDTWTQRANFPGNPRRWAVGFASGGLGYIGTGESSGVRYRDFYAYDPATNTWQQRADLGGNNRRQAFAFTINDQGYVGAGVDFVQNWTDFNRYDAASNTWVLVAPFPLPVRKNGVSFSVADSAYIVGGNGQAPVLDEVWRFSPDVSTSIGEVSSWDRTLYPSPTSDRIHFDPTGHDRYTILNGTGSVVDSGRVTGPIAVHALAPGVHLLVLDGAGGRTTARFVVER